MIKSSELNFKPVKDPTGKIKTGTVGPWACERHECTGDMQLQTFRKGAGDNLLTGLSMKVCFFAFCLFSNWLVWSGWLDQNGWVKMVDLSQNGCFGGLLVYIITGGL